MKTLFLDTETTGLHPPKDKVVEVAIADDAGAVLLDTLVNPGRPIGFATTIHGITDEMVCTAPNLESLWPNIRRIIEGHHVVIYNAQFDTRFFPDNLSCAKKISCAMLKFAPIYGARHSRRKGYNWQKLTTAADYIGYEWVGDAHRALADVLATRALWAWMNAPSEKRSNYTRIEVCPHCQTKNRVPTGRNLTEAKCGVCGLILGVADNSYKTKIVRCLSCGTGNRVPAEKRITAVKCGACKSPIPS